jgi:hypothetical protein
MRSFASAQTRERHREGSSRGGTAARSMKVAGMAAAVAWRESRRCKELVPDPLHPSGTKVCAALGFEPCAHRPNGLTA